MDNSDKDYSPEPVNRPDAVQQPVKPKPKRRYGLLILMCLILVLVGVAGGYLMRANDTNANKTATTPTVTQEDADGADNQALGSVHFVQSVGYPFDLAAKKKFTFSLGLPAEVQSVRITSGGTNRGAESVFTNKFNDEMGRWLIGYPAIQTSAASEVSILTIGNEWLSSTTNNGDTYLERGESVSSAQQKKDYLAKLKTDAEACAKDAKKGFQTKDKVFNVCYSLTPGVDAYAPIMSVRGYAEIEGRQFVMIGRLHIADVISSATDKTVLENAKKGNYPAATTELAQKFVNALSQTTVKVENN